MTEQEMIKLKENLNRAEYLNGCIKTCDQILRFLTEDKANTIRIGNMTVCLKYQTMFRDESIMSYYSPGIILTDKEKDELENMISTFLAEKVNVCKTKQIKELEEL